MSDRKCQLVSFDLFNPGIYQALLLICHPASITIAEVAVDVPTRRELSAWIGAEECPHIEIFDTVATGQKMKYGTLAQGNDQDSISVGATQGRIP
jgi:hypothetical protein